MATTVDTPAVGSIGRKTVDILAIARDALSDTKDPQRAAAQIVRLAKDDDDLADVLIRRGADQAVSLVLGDLRAKTVRAAANPDRATVRGDRGLELTEQTALKGMLNWPVPWIQKPLGEATPAELEDARSRCFAESATNAINGHFLGFVMREAKDQKKKIKQQLSPEQLRQLWARAEKAVRS